MRKFLSYVEIMMPKLKVSSQKWGVDNQQFLCPDMLTTGLNTALIYRTKIQKIIEKISKIAL